MKITGEIFEEQRLKYEESKKNLGEILSGEIKRLYGEIENHKEVLTMYRDLIDANLAEGNNELLFKDTTCSAFAVRGPILHFNKEFKTIVYFDIEEDSILVNTFNDDGSIRDEMATMSDEELIRTIGLKELLDNLHFNANLFETTAEQNNRIIKDIKNKSI